MNIFFIRHAVSKANEKKLITGYVDDVLSDEGIHQALDLKAWIQNFDFKIEKMVLKFSLV